MSRKVTITYELNPPQDTLAPTLSASKTHELLVSAGDGSLRSYYESLREALVKGKNTVGEELTAWRNAVGSGEQLKEAKTPRKSAEDDEDGEEEDEDERD